MNSEENKNFDRFGIHSDKFNMDIEANQAREILQKENIKSEEKKVEFLKDLMENLKKLEINIAQAKELIEKFRKTNTEDLIEGYNNKNSELDN